MDVQLRRGYDLVPKLVETVKGYAKHESGVVVQLVRTPACHAGGRDLDCVGVNPVKYPNEFFVALPASSPPSYLADIATNLVEHLNQKIARGIATDDRDGDLLFTPEGSRNMFSVVLTSYQGVSDEELATTWPLSIPSLYFHDDPIPPRHSQLNFLNYIDPTNLRRISYLGAIISYAFASAGEEMAPRLLSELLYRGKNRLDLELLKAKTLLEESDRENIHQNYQKGLNLLAWGKKREGRLAGSLEEIIPENEHLSILFSEYRRVVEESVQGCLNQFRKYYGDKCRSQGIRPLQKISSPPRSDWENLIPVYGPQMSVFPGCFRNYRYFEEKLGSRFLEKYKGIQSAFQHRNRSIQESFDLIDGQSTIGEIYDTLEAELWSTDTPRSPYTYLTFEEVANYFQLLKDARVVDFKKK